MRMKPLASLIFALPLLLPLTPLFSTSRGAEEVSFQSALEQQDETIRHIRLLGERKEEGGVSELVRIVRTERHPRILWNAAMVLGMLGEPGESTTALLELLQKSKDPVVRYVALTSLAALVNDQNRASILAATEQVELETSDLLLKDLAGQLARLYQEESSSGR